MTIIRFSVSGKTLNQFWGNCGPFDLLKDTLTLLQNVTFIKIVCLVSFSFVHLQCLFHKEAEKSSYKREITIKFLTNIPYLLMAVALWVHFKKTHGLDDKIHMAARPLIGRLSVLGSTKPSLKF